jgi:hypothetical protein
MKSERKKEEKKNKKGKTIVTEKLENKQYLS